MVEIAGTPIINTGGYGYGYNGMDGINAGGGNWIWAFLLFALLGRGFNYGDNGGTNPVYAAQQFSQLDNGIRSIQNGLCDTTFELSNNVKDSMYNTAMSINGINTNLGNAICSQTYELSNQIRNIGERLDSCCCTTQRAIDGVNFNNEKNANAIIQAGNTNTQRIIDWLSNKELSDKNQKIFEMSQKAQTAEIIAAQKPQAPIPAYLQPNPYASYFGGFGSYGNCCNF